MNFEYLFSKFLKKARLRAIKNSFVDKRAHIAAGCHIFESKIGKYSAIGYDCQLINCTVGNFCSFASGIVVGGAAHPMDWVSTSQVFVATKDSIKRKFAPHDYKGFKKTIIGNDVWIGDNAIIKAGVTIGDGAVIGMGAVITKDIAPYEVWGGNPAKLLKKRFDNTTIENLMATKWWELDDKEIEKYAPFFESPEAFLAEFYNFDDEKHK